jgi:hypothetical protein
MSSMHELLDLLEPSNLLEPFDPEDRKDDLAELSVPLSGDKSSPKGGTFARGRTVRCGSLAIADLL